MFACSIHEKSALFLLVLSCITVCAAQKPDNKQVCETARPRTITPGAPRYSDVGMRLFSLRNKKDTEKMIGAGKSLDITRC